VSEVPLYADGLGQTLQRVYVETYACLVLSLQVSVLSLLRPLERCPRQIDSGKRPAFNPDSVTCVMRPECMFRGGLVFKAHRLCVSLNSRLESNKEEEEVMQTP